MASVGPGDRDGDPAGRAEGGVDRAVGVVGRRAAGSPPLVPAATIVPSASIARPKKASALVGGVGDDAAGAEGVVHRAVGVEPLQHRAGAAGGRARLQPGQQHLPVGATADAWAREADAHVVAAVERRVRLPGAAVGVGVGGTLPTSSRLYGPVEGAIAESPWTMTV